MIKSSLQTTFRFGRCRDIPVGLMSGGLILGTTKATTYPESTHRNEVVSRQQ